MLSCSLSLDSWREPTMLGLTEKLIPVLAQVLGPPVKQVKQSTLKQLGNLVRWIYEQQPALLDDYENLKAAVTESD